MAAVDGPRKVLNHAYASARVEEGRDPATYTSSEDEVRKRFGPVLAARPAHPISLTAYFDMGTDEFSEASTGIVDRLQAEIARRGNTEITVIGHTDRVGTAADNDRLAELRAARMRSALIRLGLAPELITVEVRGEREPLVATADEVPEPMNRRVEINIR